MNKPPESTAATFRRWSLLPLALFLLVYVGGGLYFSLGGNEKGFYAFPPVFATIPSILLALFLAKRFNAEFFRPFAQGVLNKNVLLMCAIFALSGMFSAIAEQSGCVKATVNLGLSVIPTGFLLAGFFVLSSLMATAMGTSVGTVAALAPIALGMAQTADVSIVFMAGVLLSGAMFGDNLSLISDTSIAATSTQDCHPREKFLENVKIVAPAALGLLILYWVLSPSVPVDVTPNEHFGLVLPYVLIFVLAVIGVPVLMVLGLGCIVAACVGMYFQGMTLVEIPAVYLEGALSLFDFMLFTLVISGLGMLAEKSGGLALIQQAVMAGVSRLITNNESKKNQQSIGEIAIGLLVSLSNLATANNTIAILLSGSAARAISEQAQISKKRAASILDIFSCIVQGLIPWGMQILIISAVFKISPVDVPLYVFYPWCLLMAVGINIWIKKARLE